MITVIFWISIITILYTYIGYPVILFIVASMKKELIGKSRKIDKLFFVTLIIPAYNEEYVIKEKIENSLSLDYPRDKLEIIVGSDGSIDRTNEIVSQYEKKGVKLIVYERSGKAHMLNKIIPQARGEIIVLSDANTMYNQKAIRHLTKHFVDPEIGCVCGELKLIRHNDISGGRTEGFYWKYELFLKRLESRIKTILGANGGIYAIRKELFEPLHFNTIIDDFIIPMKIALRGYRCIYEQKAMGVEKMAKTMKEEFKRRVRIGSGNFQAIPWLLPALNPRKGFLAFALWSHKLIRWSVPFFLVFLFISNIFLLGNFVYRLFFMVQIGFYLTAGVGYFLDRLGVRVIPLTILYYFASMNLALFKGFWKCVTRTQGATWERTERN